MFNSGSILVETKAHFVISNSTALELPYKQNLTTGSICSE